MDESTTGTTAAAPPEYPDKCAQCGAPNARTHSGSLECGACWQWRKLDGPAARYWTKAIDGLFGNDLGSGPDPNDRRQWRQWGVDADVVKALNTLEALRLRYVAAVEADKARRAR